VTRSGSGSPSPVVVLVAQEGTQHQHADIMSKAGFRVVSIPVHEAKVRRVLDHAPSIVAAELSPADPAHRCELVRQFRRHPEARLIPCIVYGHRLRPADIETAARSGPCGCNWNRQTLRVWLQSLGAL
jgi:hypothetical protein